MAATTNAKQAGRQKGPKADSDHSTAGVDSASLPALGRKGNVKKVDRKKVTKRKNRHSSTLGIDRDKDPASP